MIFGNVSRFAFESEESVRLENWTFIHLRIWLGNRPFGDYEDDVALKLVIPRLESFLALGATRAERSLESLSTTEVLRDLFDSVVLTIPAGVDVLKFESPPYREPPYSQIIARFHLHEVGASAFENRVAVIMTRLGDGSERFVWRDIQTGEIGDVTYPSGSFEVAATEFLQWAKAL
jgi:hypothetical protein